MGLLYNQFGGVSHAHEVTSALLEFARLQSRLDELVSDYTAGVEHFSEDTTDDTSVVRGSGTRIWPLESDAPALWLWFDAIDNDVALQIGDFGWFEWRDLSTSGWQDDVANIVAAVLAGRVTKRSWLWHTSCEVVVEHGTVRRASSGRPIQFRRPSTVRLPPYPSRG